MDAPGPAGAIGSRLARENVICQCLDASTGRGVGGTAKEVRRDVQFRVLDKRVKHGDEGVERVLASLGESVEHAHERLASLQPRLRLRAEADFARDHQGSEFSLGEVVLGGDRAVARPMEEPMLLLPEDVLDVLHGGVPRGAGGAGADLLLEGRRGDVVLRVADGFLAQPHRLAQ